MASTSVSKLLYALLIATLAVLAPIKAMVITIVALTLADLITGLLAARKRNEKLTSRGLRRTVGKLLVYLASVVMAFVTETFLLDGMPITKLVAGTVGLTEFKSVLENLEVLTGQPIIKMILDRVSGVNPAKVAIDEHPPETP